MPEKAKRIRWRRYLFAGVFILFLLVIVFYQQIFFGAAQLIAQQVAKSQAFSLQFKIHGSIISSLYIEDLHLQPFPENTKLPLERVDASRIGLRYNLFSLFKKDFLNLIELVELKNVDVIVRPSSATPPPPQKNPNGLRIPVVLPKKIDIKDVNLILRSKDGDLEVKKFVLQFQQGTEGYLGCEALRIPSVGSWNQIHANLSYNRKKLALTNLALEPALDLRRLQIDLSGSEQGRFLLSLDAKALGSSIAANASYLQPGEQPSVDLTLDVTGLELGQVKKLTSVPISGLIPKIEVRLSGEIDRPSSFSGSISAAASGTQFENYVFDTANLDVVVDNGKGEIRELSVNSGANKMRATGTFRLAESLNELVTKSSANIGVAVAVSEPERFVPGLVATSLVTGTIGLFEGRAQAVVHEAVRGLSVPKLLPGFSVSGGDSSLLAVATLPLAPELWSSVAAIMLSNCWNISYQDARIEKVALAAEMTDGKTATAAAKLVSGKSQAGISATLPLPPPQATFDANEVAGRLNFNIAAISDFVRQSQIEGVLTANGDLRFDHLQVNGAVHASGSQLKYRGMILQSLVLNATVGNQEAQLRDFRIRLDPANYLDLSASVKLADPFPFQAIGQGNFKELAVLNEFLRDLGIEPGLSGRLDVNFNGKGDIRNPTVQLQLSGDQLQYRGFVVQDVDVQATVEHATANIQRCRISLNPDNYVDINGVAQFADPNPYQARGRIEFRDLSLFDPLLKSLKQPPGLSGALNASFSGSGDNKNAAAELKLQVEQLKYLGLLIRNISTEATVGNSKAEIQTCRVTLDANNQIELTGTARIADPFPYVVNGTIKLADLGVFNELLKNLGQPDGLSGVVNGTFASSGDAKSPAGEIQLSGIQLKYRGLLVPNVSIGAAVESGRADLKTCRITVGQNGLLDVTGEVGLDAPYPYDARGAITLPDLGVFNELLKNAGQPGDLSGNLRINFSGQGDNKNPAVRLQVLGDGLRYRGLPLEHIDIESSLKNSLVTIEVGRISWDANNYLDISGQAQTAEPNAYEARGAIALHNLAAFNDLLRSLQQPADLAGSLQIDASGKGTIKNPTAELRILGNKLNYRGLQVQSLDLKSKVQNQVAVIQSCRVNLDANNYIDLTGKAELSDPYAYQTTGAIELTDLAIFSEILKSAGQSTAVSGRVQIDWSAAGDVRSAIPDGQVRALADEVKYRGLSIQKVDVEGSLLHRKLDLPSCKVVFDQNNFIEAGGYLLLDEPYNYDATATIQFQVLRFLNEVSKSFGQDLGLGGKVSANWTGKGPIKDQAGNFELHGDQLQTRAIQRIGFDATGNYQGMNVEVPRLRISSPYADLELSIRCSPQFLEIPALNIRRNGNTITGNVKIPLNFQPGAASPLDLDQPIDVKIESEKIALSSFQSDKPQITGTIGFQLQASQTLRNPLVQLAASARDVRITSVSSLSAASADLSVRVADKLLTIDGKIQQQDVHPLLLTGRVPLDVGQMIETGHLPDDTPLQVALKWPDNNLAFVRKIVPDVKVLEGTASVDVGINGTIKRPDLSGAIRATLSRFQARTDTVPPLADFSTTITFQHDHVRFDQLKGLAGGGLFGVSGAIDVTDGTNPKFDLGVTGKQVLLTRSDGIIVRANFNLAVRGPLSGGEVSGAVGMTDSRFFKDIDILPLNLPGRPPPQPPAGAMPKIALDTPPFRDWKFNIAIRSDDPFLIQSNLARGRVSINLQAGGTGGAPTVTGYVQVDRLVASLPFSKMEINGGRIDFVQGGNILDPTLNIVGRSTVADYDVRARIFGHVSNPTVLLDSSPPLAQGDILVLLATGSTTSEYAQNPSLLAGRASFIVLEQLFRKFFPSTNRADEQKQPFIDRFSANVIPGSRIGEQVITASFKLTSNWQIIGNVGSSSAQGRLKYLIRFR
jgi:autotransporter translocation and assembly factor TamB